MASNAPRLKRIAEGVYAFFGAGPSANSGAIQTQEGIIAIDAQPSLGLARAFRSALAGLGLPLRWLVNTHYHLDHTAGNTLFAPETPILAHMKCFEKFRGILGEDIHSGQPINDFDIKLGLLYGPRTHELISPGDPGDKWIHNRLATPEFQDVIIAPPDHTFADHFEIILGGRRILLKYLGPAHSDNDIILHLPDDGVIFTGDILFVGRFPWMGDGHIDGWIDALGRVAAIDADTVVPGHGPAVGQKEVREFRGLLAALRHAVAEALAAGASEEETVRRARLPEFDALPLNEMLFPWSVRRIYRDLSSS